MNQRLDLSIFPTSPHRAVARAALVPLTDGLCAVVFDTGAGAESDRPRLGATLDGAAPPRPTLSTSLRLRTGGWRHVLLLGRGADSLLDCEIILRLGTEIAAAIDPRWLRSPVTGMEALIDGLSDAGSQRLTKLILTTGASLFRSEQDSEFSATTRHLLDAMNLRGATLIGQFPLGETGQVLRYHVEAAPEDCLFHEVTSLAPSRVARVQGFRLRALSTKTGTELLVFLPTAANAPLLGLGVAQVLLPPPGAGDAPRPLVPWLEQAEAGTRAWARDLIADQAATDTAAAALLREINSGADTPATATARHLSGTPDGILLSLAVSDPNDLLRAIRIERGGATRMLPVAPRVARFIDLPREEDQEDICRLRLVYHSGRLGTVHDGPLARLTTDMPSGFDTADAAEIARARLAPRATPPAPNQILFGTAPVHPKFSLIVALSGNLDLIHARAAMLFREAGAGLVEVIYHTDDSALAQAAAGAMTGCAAVFGIGHRLLIQAAPAIDRLRTALTLARGDGALILGAEVLPLQEGWLAAQRRALGDGATPRILGATLLGADGAVLDAGGTLRPGTSRFDRRFLGLPATRLPASASLPTDLVNSDCVALNRGAIALLTALTSPYTRPDMVLAEAVARLKAQGRVTRTQLRTRFIRYHAAPPPDSLAEAVDVAALRLRLEESTAPARADITS